MSIALMTAAFKTSLPSTQKLVLLALCDSANDQGECYPSVAVLMAKCSLSDRGVQKALSDLEESKCLRRELRHARSTLYFVTPEQCSPRTMFTPNNVHPTPEQCSPPTPNNVHPTPEQCSPITIREPSFETSKETKTRALALPEFPELADVDKKVLKDWLAIRKAKRAPLTETALAGMARESAKAGLSLSQAIVVCCELNWASFRLDWYAKTSNAKPAEGNYSRSMREKYEQAAPAIAAKQPGAVKHLGPMEILDGLTRSIG